MVDEVEVRESQRRRGMMPLSVEDQQAQPVGIEDELKQLRALIARHGRQAGQERLLITVAMAYAMLHLMLSGNRKIARAWVERWKTVILENRWHENPSQGMGFDWNGHFRDGQHRCVAIIESNVPVYEWVSFGIDPKAYHAADTGYRRNAAQNLGMQNIKHPSQIAALVRLLYRTQHSGLLPDDQLVFELGEQMAGDVLERAMDRAFKLRADRGATISSAALAYWLIAKESRYRDRLEEFWGYLVEGHDLPKDGMIFNLRRKFRSLPAGRKAHQYRSQTEQAGWIVRSWNAWINDEVLSVHAIRWPSEHKLPEVV